MDFKTAIDIIKLKGSDSGGEHCIPMSAIEALETMYQDHKRLTVIVDLFDEYLHRSICPPLAIHNIDYKESSFLWQEKAESFKKLPFVNLYYYRNKCSI